MKTKKIKTKTKTKRINSILVAIAIIIAVNISFVYVNAEQSNAEIPIEIPDQNITVEITNGIKEFDNAIDCYMYAEASMLKNTCYSTITGSVKGSWSGNVMVNQSMDNVRCFDNNGIRYSMSTSLKRGSLGRNNYQRTVYNPNVENSKVYKIVTNAANNGQPDFSNSEWEGYSQPDYINEYGSVPGAMMYLVRKSTVKSVDAFEKLEDGGYHLVLTLDNVTSIQSYKKLLRVSAGEFATNYPKFSSVRVEAWIDKYGNFVKHIMDDKAKIPMGIGALSIQCTMVSHYEETFQIIGGNVKQPFDIPFNP